MLRHCTSFIGNEQIMQSNACLRKIKSRQWCEASWAYVLSKDIEKILYHLSLWFSLNHLRAHKKYSTKGWPTNHEASSLTNVIIIYFHHDF